MKHTAGPWKATFINGKYSVFAEKSPIRIIAELPRRTNDRETAIDEANVKVLAVAPEAWIVCQLVANDCDLEIAKDIALRIMDKTK